MFVARVVPEVSQTDSGFGVWEKPGGSLLGRR